MMPPATRLILFVAIVIALQVQPALAQDGALLTDLENEIATASQGWESTVMDAARSLFWILAGIELAIAAVWLALSSASLDTWFAELVRRICSLGFSSSSSSRVRRSPARWSTAASRSAPAAASASPANVFNAGLQVASQMSEKARFSVVRRQCAGDRGGVRHGDRRHLVQPGRRDLRSGDGRDVCWAARRHDHAWPWRDPASPRTLRFATWSTRSPSV